MDGGGAAERTVLVTGAGGYIGRELIEAITRDEAGLRIVAVDVRDWPATERLLGVTYHVADIRDSAFGRIVARERPDAVVHLASVVGAGGDPDFDYSIDVLGTRNVLDACLAAGVEQLIVTSSGAAYGYHADNPAWLNESHPLRGNEDFPYSRNKRLVEEMLAEARERHPRLRQLVFRPGTVLGRRVANQITALFEKSFVLGVAGSASPFVFIWDADVINCIVKGVRECAAGVYNLAGDGALPMREIAALLGKPYVPLPAGLIGAALGTARLLGRGRLGPEHVKFLRYRPVLDNARLKAEFGYTPALTSRQAFERFVVPRAAAGRMAA
ncbi:MAG: SDR family oxidoreductase [Rhodospirillales bacterium]|nr:SDR family oxidoreductase [Rhodospirillales bacterium]